MTTQLPYYERDIGASSTTQVHELVYQSLICGQVHLLVIFYLVQNEGGACVDQENCCMTRCHPFGFYEVLYILFLIDVEDIFLLSYLPSHDLLSFPRSFILNSTISLFFSHSKASRLLEPSARSSTYTPTIMSSPSHWMVIIHVSALLGVKPILLKNLVIVLFESCPACFRPYKLFKILQTRPSRPTRHPCRILIKIGYLFWLSVLSRYAPTMSICMSIISSIATMAKNILNNSHLTVGAKFSVQSIP